jgi:hypothetical protein
VDAYSPFDICLVQGPFLWAPFNENTNVYKHKGLGTLLYKVLDTSLLAPEEYKAQTIVVKPRLECVGELPVLQFVEI